MAARISVALAAFVALAVATTGCGGSGSGSSSSGQGSTPSPSFSISAPSSITVTQNSTQAISISITPDNGFSSSVNVSLSGLPTGVSAEPATFTLTPGSSAQSAHVHADSSGSGAYPSQTVTITANGNATPGPISFTVSAASGSISQTATGVTNEADFAISGPASAVSLTAGSSMQMNVSAAAFNGFTGQVSATITGLPAGVTASQSALTLTPGTPQMITLTANAGASSASSTLVLQGTSGTLSHNLEIPFSLATAPPPAPDFSLSVTPGTLSLQVGGSNQQVMVSATAINGFSGSINVTISGLPSGVSASPATFGLTPGNPAQPVTFTSTSAATTGSTTVGFNGISGSVSSSIQLTLNLTPPPDFSISTAPTSLSLLAGGISQQLTVSIAALYGFAGTANVTITGLPTGVTAAPSTFSVIPGTPQTVTLTASAAAATTSTAISIQAVSGSITHAVSLPVTVSPAPDLSDSVSPTSLTTNEGTPVQLNVSASSVNGSQGSVTVTVQVLQYQVSGVTVSPSTFSLAPNSVFPTVSQTVTVNVPSNAITSNNSQGIATLIISFSNQPTGQYTSVPVTINPYEGSGSGGSSAQPSPYAPVRERFLSGATSVMPGVSMPGALSGDALRHTVAYSAVHQQFVSADTEAGEIVAYGDSTNSKSELALTAQVVNGPLSMDTSVDGTTLYVTDALGGIDPFSWTPLLINLPRIPQSSIGPSGIPFVDSVLALANGNFVLNGTLIWNKAANTLTQIPGQSGCVYESLTPDRTILLGLASSSTGTQLCTFNTLSLQGLTSSPLATSGAADIPNLLLATPDDAQVFAAAPDGTVRAFSMTSLQQTSQFVGGDAGVINNRGTILYLENQGTLTAYSTTPQSTGGAVTYASLGTVSNYSLTPVAIDASGLIFGPSFAGGPNFPAGSSFADGSQIVSTTPLANLSLPSPSFGNQNGGDTITATVGGPSLNSSAVLQGYLGNQPLQNLQVSGGVMAATPPPYDAPVVNEGYAPNSQDVVDFSAIYSDLSTGYQPQSFGYGPPIITDVLPTAATASGGGNGVIFGYNFGQDPSAIQLTINSQAVQVNSVTQISPEGASLSPTLPLEVISFVIPSGTPGTGGGQNIHLTITSTNPETYSGNSTTAVYPSFAYIPQPIVYPLNDSLEQGIFDPTRDLYYFSGQNKVEVFSLASGAWQSPITFPNTNSSTRLMGIALSSDGTKLAVSDSGNKLIYVLDPSNSAAAQSFAVSAQTTSNGPLTPPPGALAVTNSGVVYYSTQGTAPLLNFHELNSTMGVTTDFPGFPGLPATESPVVLLSADGSTVYTDVCANCSISTATDQVTNGLPAFAAPNLALSPDGTTLANDAFYFGSTAQTLQPTDVWEVPTGNYLSGQPSLPAAANFPVDYEIYGEKLDGDTIVIQPRSGSLDIASESFVGAQVQLPFSLVSPNPGGVPSFVAPLDALVSTNQTGVFLVILPSGGIAEVNVTFLEELLN